MAADDEKTPEPDPWADIVADGLDVNDETSLPFTADERPADKAPAAETSSPFELDGATGDDAVETDTGLAGIEGLEAEADVEAVADAAADDLLSAVENDAAEADPWGDFGSPSGGEAGEVSTAATADAPEDAGEFPFAAPDAEEAAAAPIAAPPAAVPRGQADAAEAGRRHRPDDRRRGRRRWPFRSRSGS